MKFLYIYNTCKYDIMKIPLIFVVDKVVDIANNNVVGCLHLKWEEVLKFE